MNALRVLKSKIDIAPFNMLSALLLLFYISESINKIYISRYYESFVWTAYLKVLVILIAFLFLVKQNYKSLVGIVLIMVCFVVGQYYINPNFEKHVLINVLKYVFAILMLLFFRELKLSGSKVKNAALVFEYIILFNSLLILLGFFFDIPIFKTYKTRYGYNGLLTSSATSSYVYFIAIIYYINKYKVRIVINWQALLVLTAGILVGTKSLYLVFVLMGIYFGYIFVKTDVNKIKKIGLITLLIGLGVFTGLKLETKFRIIAEEHDLLTSILSFRNQLLVDQVLPFIEKQWTLINYAFGGVNDISSRAQLGLFDLLYFFGLIGTVLYLYFYFKALISFKINSLYIFFLVLLALLIFTTGNFFLNASVVIYMVLLKEVFRIKHIEKKENQ
ncbi:MAG: hypothetical protein HRT67_11635 [Flavobacteriaceae bacterium]|nr:hypothetical protein [Flavobacteriaceae bacterium]